MNRLPTYTSAPKLLPHLLLLLCLALSPAFDISSRAQQGNQKARLEKSKNDLENEITFTSRLLEETRKKRQSSVNQVVILSNQIKKREKLINTIGEEVEEIHGEIGQQQQQLEHLRKELNNLKKEYASLVYQAYKNRNAYSRLMFIFASKDFNQAYQRLKYFQQFGEYRKAQMQRIQQTQGTINVKIKDLSGKKDHKLTLLHSKEKEKNKLTREKKEKDLTVKSLQQKEQALRKKLKEKEKARQKLQQAIEALIAEEIRRSAPAEPKGGTDKASPATYSLTPEEKELSSNFSNNKGKLPWPVEKGIISSTFGEHTHPVLKGIKTKNNGVNITTAEGSAARAVFAGTVSAVMSIPNMNRVVIIRHGDYLTVYSNLENVTVKAGDKVKTKQILGKVYTDSDDAKTEVHFEVWQGKKLLDPQNWLAR